MNVFPSSKPVCDADAVNAGHIDKYGVGIREFVILAVVSEHGLSTPEYLVTRTGLGVRPVRQCTASLCESGLLNELNPVTGAVAATQRGSALVRGSGCFLNPISGENP